jgi:polysaccharide chain length determinant protein (PEP-CTERM system associated)
MTEELFEQKSSMRGLGDYWDIVVRRRWWILGPLFFGFLLVFASAWLIPAEYTSEALILVEQQKIPEQYVMPNVQVDLNERLQSITQQVLSRTRLLNTIKALHLYSGDTPDNQVDRMRKDIKIDLVQTKSQNGRDVDLTAFKVSYTSSKPDIAQQVNTQLATYFVDENLKQSQEQSQITTNFLDANLRTAGEQMAATDAKVRAFQAAHNGSLPDQLQSNIQILSGTQAELQRALEARDHALQQQEYLNSMLSQYESIGATQGVNSGPNLDQQLNTMKAALAELRTKYTDDHPDIKKLKEQIASTEKLTKEIEAAKRESSKSDANSAEVSAMAPLLQLQSQIKVNKLELQSREAEIPQLQRKVAEYQNRLNATPAVEQELTAMLRNEEQSKKDYDTLLAKTAQSNLATNLQKQQQGEQFRVIDPASLPDKPSFPDRFKFSLAGLGVGLVLAVLFGAGTEFTDDRIRGEYELTDTNLPLLAEIPPLPTAGEVAAARWRPYYALAAAILIVILIPCGILYAFYWG